MPKKQINVVNLSDVKSLEEATEIQQPENDERTQIKQAIEMDDDDIITHKQDLIDELETIGTELELNAVRMKHEQLRCSRKDELYCSVNAGAKSRNGHSTTTTTNNNNNNNYNTNDVDRKQNHDSSDVDHKLDSDRTVNHDDDVDDNDAYDDDGHGDSDDDDSDSDNDHLNDID